MLGRRKTNRKKSKFSVSLAGLDPAKGLRGLGDAARAVGGMAVGLAGSVRGAMAYALVAVALFALPIIGVRAWEYFDKSDAFVVRLVNVTGERQVSEEDIRAFAGIGEGTSVVGLDESDIRREVERHPWVRRARVEITLPDTVDIHVWERGAAAVVVLGKLYLADDKGVVFKPVGPEDDLEGLVYLTGFDREDLFHDDKKSQAEQRVRDGIGVADVWRGHPVERLEPLGEVHYDDVFGWRVVGAGQGVEVQLGWGDLQEKLDKLEQVLFDARRRGAQLELVRLDDEKDARRVVVRMRYDAPMPGGPAAEGLPSGEPTGAPAQPGQGDGQSM
jgi:cell division protein FtsQ